ncbi:MAG: DUF4091 domain-containing protein [Clostridia bacterium]|nr:DUF4091 domain-containing protein [Clostridia bacterium]
MLNTKIISSLEKAFVNGNIDGFDALERVSILKNERFSFQFIFTQDHAATLRPTISFSGALSEYVSVRKIMNVPSLCPYTDKHDDNFLYTEPTLCPDLLCPHDAYGRITIGRKNLSGVWVEIDLRNAEDITPALSGPLTVTLTSNGESLSENTLEIEIIDAEIPAQSLICTDWFHCDSLAHYYGCEVWSERHWEVIENFVKTAVSNGINMLLTPLVTPPLDTNPGKERLTTQLLGITVKNGIFSFDFSLLDRWIDVCDRAGVKYFEICHLFTQWGAMHAPKVMATVDGEYKRLFGWDTDATDPEYVRFLQTVLPAFLEHMKARGDDKRCVFHVSDEPLEAHLESYKKARAIVEDVLSGYKIMDACSHVEYFENGIISDPVPANDMITPFLEHKVPNLWTYYCCCQTVGVSNRLMAMPSWRNRILGVQMFKFDIAGFLHWGYNFYNSERSVQSVIPFVETGADHAFPDGDSFSVYPASDGTALESLRMIVFHEALQDMRVLQLCASLYGKDAVIEALEDELGEIKFDVCPTSAAPLLRAREKINQMIKDKVK